MGHLSATLRLDDDPPLYNHLHTYTPTHLHTHTHTHTHTHRQSDNKTDPRGISSQKQRTQVRMPSLFYTRLLSSNLWWYGSGEERREGKRSGVQGRGEEGRKKGES